MHLLREPMAGPPSTAPITAHPALGKLDPHVVASGPAIPPIERVALFSEEQWEHFTDEWAKSLTDYAKVERASGAGDKGCGRYSISHRGELA